MRAEIQAKLLEKRPKLSAGSLRTYASLVANLCARQKYEKLSQLDEHADDVLNNLAQHPNQNGKKTLLSALFILTENQKYRDAMMESQAVVRDTYAKGRLQPKEVEKGRLNYEQVCARVADLERTLKTNPTLDNYVAYFAASLMSGARGIPPRRNEWRTVKLKEFKKETDNYLDLKKGVVVFNSYKTSKRYGQQIEQIQPAMMKYIRKYAKITPSDYLLFNTNTGKPFQTCDMARFLGRVFEHPTSCDTLRSIYVSHEMKDVDMRAIADTAQRMGHSLSVAAAVYNRKE